MVCVQTERQMVFYNRILVASGKEMERQTDHAITSTALKCVVFVNESSLNIGG